MLNYTFSVNKEIKYFYGGQTFIFLTCVPISVSGRIFCFQLPAKCDKLSLIFHTKQILPLCVFSSRLFSSTTSWYCFSSSMDWLRLRLSGRRTFSSDSQSSPCWSTCWWKAVDGRRRARWWYTAEEMLKRLNPNKRMWTNIEKEGRKWWRWWL